MNKKLRKETEQMEHALAVELFRKEKQTGVIFLHAKESMWQEMFDGLFELTPVLPEKLASTIRFFRHQFQDAITIDQDEEEA